MNRGLVKKNNQKKVEKRFGDDKKFATFAPAITAKFLDKMYCIFYSFKGVKNNQKKVLKRLGL